MLDNVIVTAGRVVAMATARRCGRDAARDSVAQSSSLAVRRKRQKIQHQQRTETTTTTSTTTTKVRRGGGGNETAVEGDGGRIHGGERQQRPKRTVGFCALGRRRARACVGASGADVCVYATRKRQEAARHSGSTADECTEGGGMAAFSDRLHATIRLSRLQQRRAMSVVTSSLRRPLFAHAVLDHAAVSVT